MKKSLSATVMCALVFNSGEQERHELDVIEIKWLKSVYWVTRLDRVRNDEVKHTLSFDTKIEKYFRTWKFITADCYWMQLFRCCDIWWFIVHIDVQREKVSFFKQFYSLYEKLFCTNHKVLIHLIKIHAICFYSVETWLMKLHTKDLNNISVAYHKAIKRVCNKRSYNSTHGCLERVNLPIFKHSNDKKVINSGFSIFQSDGPCLLSHKYYFRAYSNYGKEIKNVFVPLHVCTVIARIDLIQRTEPRSEEMLKNMALC